MLIKRPSILLINPPRSAIEDPYDIPENPSTGLAYLAAVLVKEKIIPICIDAKFEKINYKQFEDRIKKIEYIDIVGVTSMTRDIEDAHDSIKIVKKYHPKAIAITGGVHTTAIPVETMKEFKYFDIAVIGEGEDVLLEIVNAAEKNKDFSEIKGIIYRKESELITTPPRIKSPNLDELPFPAWHLFLKQKSFLPILTSRGCPFPCNFCMKVTGSKVSMRSPESVLDEIKYLIDNFGVNCVGILDETFTLNKKRVNTILKMIVDENLHKKITWIASCRVDTVDYKILSSMKQAGCIKVGFGVESGNDEILKNSRKGITKIQAENAITAAKSLGLKVNAFFIFGHPNETVETINDTIRFATKLNPTFAAFGIMVPFPGTKIRGMALKGEGGYSYVSKQWRDYGKNTGYPMELKEISKKKLISLQMKAYFQFYLYNFRYIDFFRLLFKTWKTVFIIIKKSIRLRGYLTK